MNWWTASTTFSFSWSIPRRRPRTTPRNKGCEAQRKPVTPRERARPTRAPSDDRSSPASSARSNGSCRGLPSIPCSPKSLDGGKRECPSFIASLANPGHVPAPSSPRLSLDAIEQASPPLRRTRENGEVQSHDARQLMPTPFPKNLIANVYRPPVLESPCALFPRQVAVLRGRAFRIDLLRPMDLLLLGFFGLSSGRLLSPPSPPFSFLTRKAVILAGRRPLRLLGVGLLLQQPLQLLNSLPQRSDLVLQRGNVLRLLPDHLVLLDRPDFPCRHAHGHRSNTCPPFQKTPVCENGQLPWPLAA